MSEKNIIAHILTTVYQGTELVHLDMTVGHCIRIIFDKCPLADIRRQNGMLDVVFESDVWHAHSSGREIGSTSTKVEIMGFLKSVERLHLTMSEVSISEGGDLRIGISDGGQFSCCRGRNAAEDSVSWYLKVGRELDVFGLQNGELSLS